MGSQASLSPLAQTLNELRAEVAALEDAGTEPLTDTLARFLTAHYAVAAKKAVTEMDGALDLKTLRTLTADVVALRQGDHSALRLRQEREWRDLERERWTEKRKELINAGLDALAEEVRDKPAARAAFDTLRQIVQPAAGERLSEEERAERIREIFGMPRRQGLSPEALAEIERAARLL